MCVCVCVSVWSRNLKTMSTPDVCCCDTHTHTHTHKIILALRTSVARDGGQARWQSPICLQGLYHSVQSAIRRNFEPKTQRDVNTVRLWLAKVKEVQMLLHQICTYSLHRKVRNFRLSAVEWTRSSLFWDVTQRRFVVTDVAAQSVGPIFKG